MGCYWRPTGNQLHRSRHAGAMPAAACSNISVGCTHRMWTAAGQAVAWRGGGTNCPSLHGVMVRRLALGRPAILLASPTEAATASACLLQRASARRCWRSSWQLHGRQAQTLWLCSYTGKPRGGSRSSCCPRWAQSGSRNWSTNVQTSCCRLHRQPVHAAIASACCAAAGAPTGAGCRRPPSAGWAMPSLTAGQTLSLGTGGGIQSAPRHSPWS